MLVFWGYFMYILIRWFLSYVLCYFICCCSFTVFMVFLLMVLRVPRMIRLKTKESYYLFLFSSTSVYCLLITSIDPHSI